jgi:hypothetical protein
MNKLVETSCLDCRFCITWFESFVNPQCIIHETPSGDSNILFPKIGVAADVIDAEIISLSPLKQIGSGYLDIG